MNKLFFPSHIMSKIIVFLFLLTPEFILLLSAFSSDSIDFPRNYKNCTKKSSFMNKIFLQFNLFRKIIMLLLWSTLGSLHSPQVLANVPGQGYRYCAELQKHLNDNNPETRFQGFEKFELQTERLMSFQSVYATAYFCNGGTRLMRHKDGVKKLCNAYIV